MSNKDNYEVYHYTRQSWGSFRITCLSTSSRELLQSSLANGGFECYWVDSRAIKCRNSLLAALAEAFQLELCAGPLDHWDAAIDLVWQQLMAQPSNRAAVIVTNVDELIRAGHLQLLLDALECLVSLADMVVRQAPGDGVHPVLLRIILLDDGPGFPPLK